MRRIDICLYLSAADLAELCRDMGDGEAAVAALDRAAELAPTQQKFVNRKKRYRKKAEKMAGAPDGQSRLSFGVKAV